MLVEIHRRHGGFLLTLGACCCRGTLLLVVGTGVGLCLGALARVRATLQLLACTGGGVVVVIVVVARLVHLRLVDFDCDRHRKEQQEERVRLRLTKPKQSRRRKPLTCTVGSAIVVVIVVVSRLVDTTLRIDLVGALVGLTLIRLLNTQLAIHLRLRSHRLFDLCESLG